MGNDTSMKKEIKTIIITSILLVILFIILVISFIVINNQNKELKKGDLIINIYQYDVIDYNINYNSERILYKSLKFTSDTYFDEIIYSKDHTLYNHVEIKDGICKVIDANCMNHICMASHLSVDIELINPKSIICMPSGLYIELVEG